MRQDAINESTSAIIWLSSGIKSHLASPVLFTACLRNKVLAGKQQKSRAVLCRDGQPFPAYGREGVGFSPIELDPHRLESNAIQTLNGSVWWIVKNLTFACKLLNWMISKKGHKVPTKSWLTQE